MTLRQWKKQLIKETEKADRNIDFFNVRVFEKIPKVLRVSQEDEGKKLWLADEYRTKIIRLKKYKDDSLEISYAGEKKHRTIYPQEAALHPDELTEKRLNKFGIEIKDGRSS